LGVTTHLNHPDMKVLLGSAGWEDEGDIPRMSTHSTIDDVIKSICPTKVTEDPFYIVDLDDIINKLNTWKMQLPRVEPFYAVKCNNSEKVIQLLAALGTGFDCASKGEIQQVLSVGVSPDRIIYANPCKTRSFISYANKQGVNMMTFDNETELFKIRDKFPNAQLVLRIKADAADSQCTSFGVKFGADISDVPALLETAKSLSLNVVGVSFHVGSGCRDNTAFPRAISAAKSVFHMAQELGMDDMYLLDIGGGFPGHDDGNMTFTELSLGINSALAEHFPVGCGVRIIAEPGRYMVASAFTLATNVIAKRQVSGVDESQQSFMYYINDGIYGSFNCLLYDNAKVYPHLFDNKYVNEKHYECSIWGPTCDSLDKVVDSCRLRELEVGDWLMFSNMGAYTLSAATNFNGFVKPGLHFSIHLDTWMCLKNNVCGKEVLSSLVEVKSTIEEDDRSAMLAEWMKESSRLARILDSLTSSCVPPPTAPAPHVEADGDPTSTSTLLRALRITT